MSHTLLELPEPLQPERGISRPENSEVNQQRAD